MTGKDLYSVRMRASAAEQHVSGAERLIPRGRISDTVRELIDRALERGIDPDRVTVSIDAIGDALVLDLRALDLTAVTMNDLTECRKTAAGILSGLGVSPDAVEAAMTALDQGASLSGGNMRGAMLIDAKTGDRLEQDRTRGVRVSRFDWSDEASENMARELARLGLTHFRTREALALATKVAHAPGIVAELCWSDDPDYTAGYVASRSGGYIRLPQMKRRGSSLGGRAFFLRREALSLDALLDYLQRSPVLINAIGTCRVAERPVPSVQQA